MKYTSKSEQETFVIAEKIAQTAKPGDIFALKGDLGSGKTTFTKAFAKAIGVVETITSPTFVIQKNYSFACGSGKCQFVHIDAYRFESVKDAKSIGFEELLQQKNVIIMLEWPEKVWPLIEDRAKQISFEYINEKSRKITIGES